MEINDGSLDDRFNQLIFVNKNFGKLIKNCFNFLLEKYKQGS